MYIITVKYALSTPQPATNNPCKDTGYIHNQSLSSNVSIKQFSKYLIHQMNVIENIKYLDCIAEDKNDLQMNKSSVIK